MQTSSTSSVWTTENSQGMQTIYGIVGTIVGSAFVLGSRIQSLEQVARTSVLLLGILITLISLVTLIIGGKQVISVDPRRRLVALETISRFGTRTRLIPFNLIAETFVGELGDKEGGSVSYHVVLKLNDGKEVALFIGAFEGTFNRPAMEARCNRINEYLRNQ